MADGREYRVDHPDFVLASPSHESLVIIEEPDTDKVHQLSALLITGIDHAADTNFAA